MIYCISCNNKNDNTFVSRDEYLGYVYYDDTDWCEKCKCQKVLTKDILFSFDKDFPIDLSSIDYEFLIIRQGVIYRGRFENDIIIDNLAFCMDDNLSKVNTLAFALLDHTNKLVYNWYINGITRNHTIYIRKTSITYHLEEMVIFHSDNLIKKLRNYIF